MKYNGLYQFVMPGVNYLNLISLDWAEFLQLATTHQPKRQI